MTSVSIFEWVEVSARVGELISGPRCTRQDTSEAAKHRSLGRNRQLATAVDA